MNKMISYESAKKLKNWMAGLAWRVFLWGNNVTAKEYRLKIYHQEKDRIDHPELYPFGHLKEKK